MNPDNNAGWSGQVGGGAGDKIEKKKQLSRLYLSEI